MRKAFLALSVILVFSAVSCYADGLGTLMQVGKSMDEIQRVYDRETATYDRVRKAIDSGAIKGGQLQGAILKYGNPVAVVTEPIKNRQVWVYRPGTTDLLNRPKIRLFFDENGILGDIMVLE